MEGHTQGVIVLREPRINAFPDYLASSMSSILMSAFKYNNYHRGVLFSPSLIYNF